MSSIRQSASSSTLSTSSSSYNSPASITSSDDTSSSNTAHSPSETPPQYPQPAHHRSSTSHSSNKDLPISNIHNPPYSQTPPSHHHHKSLRPTSEPLIHPIAVKKPNTKKGHRSCMANFDFTYSGLYVSGSRYGRKTLGTGTGAGGSGECVLM